MGIVSEAGQLVVSYEYDAWGNVLEISGSMATTLGTLNPLTYRGYVYDHETDLYYLQSRYYNPEWGRFLNADSFVSTGGILGSNMFAYCGNNPVRYADYSGHEIEVDFYNDDDWDPFDDTPFGYGYSSYANAYNSIDAGYSYSINLSVTSNSSLLYGGLYNTGYSVDIAYSAPGNPSKEHTPDQRALFALAKEYQKTGVTMEEAHILVDWANQYGIDSHLPKTHPERSGYWSNVLHINIAKIHIAVITK
jgi:RHS repeat-associated protein